MLSIDIQHCLASIQSHFIYFHLCDSGLEHIAWPMKLTVPSYEFPVPLFHHILRIILAPILSLEEITKYIS